MVKISPDKWTSDSPSVKGKKGYISLRTGDHNVYTTLNEVRKSALASAERYDLDHIVIEELKPNTFFSKRVVGVVYHPYTQPQYKDMETDTYYIINKEGRILRPRSKEKGDTIFWGYP